MKIPITSRSGNIITNIRVLNYDEFCDPPMIFSVQEGWYVKSKGMVFEVPSGVTIFQLLCMNYNEWSGKPNERRRWQLLFNTRALEAAKTGDIAEQVKIDAKKSFRKRLQPEIEAFLEYSKGCATWYRDDRPEEPSAEDENDDDDDLDVL